MTEGRPEIQTLIAIMKPQSEQHLQFIEQFFDPVAAIKREANCADSGELRPACPLV